MIRRMKIYVYGCLIIFSMAYSLGAMESSSTLHKKIDYYNLEEELHEIETSVASLRFSAGELIIDMSVCSSENEELLLKAQLSLYESIQKLLGILDSTYKCRQKLKINEIKRIDESTRNSTLSLEAVKLLAAQQEELYKIVILLAEKRKEVVLSLLEASGKMVLLRKNMLLLDKASKQMKEHKSEWAEKNINQKEIEKIALLFTSSTGELIKDMIAFFPANEELLLNVRLSLYESTLELLERRDSIYKYRQKFMIKEIQRIDEPIRNSTLPPQYVQFPQAHKEDFYKMIHLIQEKRGEIYVRQVEVMKKVIILSKNKALLLDEALGKQEERMRELVKTYIHQKNKEIDDLDKDTHELSCCIQ